MFGEGGAYKLMLAPALSDGSLGLVGHVERVDEDRSSKYVDIRKSPCVLSWLGPEGQIEEGGKSEKVRRRWNLIC
jgi:hypothetical protein